MGHLDYMEAFPAVALPSAPAHPPCWGPAVGAGIFVVERGVAGHTDVCGRRPHLSERRDAERNAQVPAAVGTWSYSDPVSTPPRRRRSRRRALLGADGAGGWSQRRRSAPAARQASSSAAGRATRRAPSRCRSAYVPGSGSRGCPRIRSAITLRCTSLVPPAMVRQRVERKPSSQRCARPACTAASAP